MPVHSVALWTLMLTATLGLAAVTTETPEDTEPKPVESIVEGVPIDSGFVILKGKYLSSPYVVGRRGEELFINGRSVDTERFHMRRWGSRGSYPGREGGFRTGGAEGNLLSSDTEQSSHRRSSSSTAYVEHQLQSNALLIVFDDEMAVFVPGRQEMAVLEILLGKLPQEDKVQALMKLRTMWIDSARWNELVHTFQPSTELAERVAKIQQVIAAKHPRRVASPSLPHFIKYGITIMGIVLGIVALGSLLNHRPDSQARWREIDSSGDSIPMTIRNVAFVVVLGFFDLGCTLLAQGSTGFIEINPLGSELLSNPVLLAGFKVASLLVGCTILLALRRYRGAQVASWWLCLACTILTFRWATYGSLFLA
ncbi:MAG: hypothetical protein JW888_15810 [Pirellulales bacterium]|nr:hypothetical protein [Pirellulales bacterium]